MERMSPDPNFPAATNGEIPQMTPAASPEPPQRQAHSRPIPRPLVQPSRPKAKAKPKAKPKPKAGPKPKAKAKKSSPKAKPKAAKKSPAKKAKAASGRKRPRPRRGR